VPDEVRDVFLELVADRLNPGGLLYLNYNTRPGWNIRGLVRDFLIAQTAEEPSLRARARQAQEVSARVVNATLSTIGCNGVFSQIGRYLNNFNLFSDLSLYLESISDVLLK
jgi:hypothetical protein